MPWGSQPAPTLLRLAIAHPGHFERIALLGLGDNVFETHDASTLARALESEDEPGGDDDLFISWPPSAGNDPKALSAFIRRARPPIREEDLATVTCPVLVVLGDRDMTTSAARLVSALPSASLVTLAGVDNFATPSDFGAIDATMRFLGLA